MARLPAARVPLAAGATAQRSAAAREGGERGARRSTGYGAPARTSYSPCAGASASRRAARHASRVALSSMPSDRVGKVRRGEYFVRHDDDVAKRERELELRLARRARELDSMYARYHALMRTDLLRLVDVDERWQLLALVIAGSPALDAALDAARDARALVGGHPAESAPPMTAAAVDADEQLVAGRRRTRSRSRRVPAPARAAALSDPP